jgi:hypothetical protein
MVSADLLKQHPFFKEFSEEQIKKLADMAAEESYVASIEGAVHQHENS